MEGLGFVNAAVPCRVAAGLGERLALLATAEHFEWFATLLIPYIVGGLF